MLVDYVSLEISKKRGLSINPDIHHSKVPNSDQIFLNPVTKYDHRLLKVFIILFDLITQV